MIRTSRIIAILLLLIVLPTMVWGQDNRKDTSEIRKVIVSSIELLVAGNCLEFSEKYCSPINTSKMTEEDLKMMKECKEEDIINLIHVLKIIKNATPQYNNAHIVASFDLSGTDFPIREMKLINYDGKWLFMLPQ